MKFCEPKIEFSISVNSNCTWMNDTWDDRMYEKAEIILNMQLSKNLHK